jgi:hypothetical protein
MNKKRAASCFVALFFILLSSSLLLGLSGCTLFGVIAGKVAPAQTIPAKYKGLANQSIAIMVWAGEGTMIDFPDIRLDLAGGLQKKLIQAQQAKAKELAGVTFPTKPSAIIQYQDNHPQSEAVPVADLAPRFGASRLIYVEIESLQTRSDASVELYRGSALATVKIIEVPPEGGSGKVVYEESAIATVFPPKAREEGTPNGNDFVIYRGTVDALSTEIAKRFIPYQEEQ